MLQTEGAPTFSYLLFLSARSIMMAERSDEASGLTETPQSERRPIKRSRKGCLTCRQRKVKCDERLDVCERCAKLGITCEWPRKDVPDSAAPHDESLTDHHEHRSQPLTAEAAASARRQTTPNGDDTHSDMDCIDAYYRFVYVQPGLSFLHRATLMRERDEGRLSPILLASIRLCAGRYLAGADKTHSDGGLRHYELAQNVKQSILADTDRFSTVKLAALLNLLTHERISGRHGSTWLLLSLASRMCLAMGLNRESDAHLSWVSCESRRRMVWATYLMDAFNSSGHREFATLPIDILLLDLPAPERNFALGMAIKMPTLQTYESSPITMLLHASSEFACYVALIAIRGRILR